MRISRRLDHAKLHVLSASRTGVRARRGFTIIELVVSIIIMTVGVLALATGSAGVARQMRAGNQSAVATMVAQARMENIRSLGCTSLASGNATTRGMTEKWAVSWLSSRSRVVTESVTYVPRAKVSRTLAMRSVVPCL